MPSLHFCHKWLYRMLATVCHANFQRFNFCGSSLSVTEEISLALNEQRRSICGLDSVFTILFVQFLSPADEIFLRFQLVSQSFYLTPLSTLSWWNHELHVASLTLAGCKLPAAHSVLVFFPPTGRGFWKYLNANIKGPWVRRSGLALVWECWMESFFLSLGVIVGCCH